MDTVKNEHNEEPLIFKPDYPEARWVGGLIGCLLFSAFFLLLIHRKYGFDSYPFISISIMAFLSAILLSLTGSGNIVKRVEFYPDFVLIVRSLFPPLRSQYCQIVISDKEIRYATIYHKGKPSVLYGFIQSFSELENASELKQILCAYRDRGIIEKPEPELNQTQLRRAKIKKVMTWLLWIIGGLVLLILIPRETMQTISFIAILAFYTAMAASLVMGIIQELRGKA